LPGIKFAGGRKRESRSQHHQWFKGKERYAVMLMQRDNWNIRAALEQQITMPISFSEERDVEL
jgi:hypothetical protein